MTRARVLLVDDNQNIRLGLRLYLQACDFDVLESADCAAARQLIRERTFDVAVLDYALPDGTALTVLADIAAEQPSLKAIVLTAYPSATLAQEALQAGAARFLIKPVEMAALRALLEELAASGTSDDSTR